VKSVDLTRKLSPYSGHRHIPYGDVRKNWKTSERDKYWERHGGREWHGEERREPDLPGPDRERGRGRHGD